MPVLNLSQQRYEFLSIISASYLLLCNLLPRVVLVQDEHYCKKEYWMNYIIIISLHLHNTITSTHKMNTFPQWLDLHNITSTHKMITSTHNDLYNIVTSTQNYLQMIDPVDVMTCVSFRTVLPWKHEKHFNASSRVKSFRKADL